ncbi:NAD(P)H-binding protein [Actinokineospora fastidiosa]|uniref:Nucleotide-diphosphate-sugar epimerase n=1 Tax=Actinokineospora fastidiosa TaxID=1816 RepID=A0A918GCW7_9PSEU|nr:NAD(P)H-binding protein [Actinokineospora fastidiosa]GGS30550.1 nucleotide-diphosphate-sugar epimerase [Actinokineospora fastidiosa]
MSRDATAAALPVPVVEADPAQPRSLAEALDGVTALFLHPRAVGAAAADLVALARERGVRRVVALSAMNVDDPLAEQPSRYRGDRNKEAEDAVVGSGLGWTSLRVGAFAGNAVGMFGAQLRAGDVVRYPFPGFAESPIHERDIAEVAARALLTDDLVDQRLDLTGPRSLTHADMVAIIGDVLGRRLRYEEITVAEATARMVAHGLPEPFVTALMARYTKHADAPQHPPTDDVAKVLGRPARPFAEWVADNAAAFQNADR